MEKQNGLRSEKWKMNKVKSLYLCTLFIIWNDEMSPGISAGIPANKQGAIRKTNYYANERKQHSSPGFFEKCN